MKNALLAAAALVLALGGVLGAAAASSAAPAPSPSPTGTPTYVTYSGSSTETTADGNTLPTNLASEVRIDCSSGECVATVLTIDDVPDNAGLIDFTQGKRLVLIDGKLRVAMPAFGDLCGAYWVGAGTLTLDATATGFVGTRTSAPSGEIHCADGSEAAAPAFVVTDRSALSGGDPCVLDASCPTPTPTAAASAIPSAAGPGSPAKATHFSSPSTLSALPTVTKSLTVHNLLWAAAITVVLVLLVAFPTHLFNTATEHGADRAREWWAKRRRARVEKTANARPVEYRGWPLAAGGVLLASLISSFVDPSFGFNAASVRVFLSILASFLLDAVAGWFLLIYLVRRTNREATATFRFSPASLLVVVAAVLFTRLTGFAPGIIFGLVAGVAFGAVLATAEKARVALVGLGYSFAVAVIGWVGYSILNGTAGAHPSAGIVFLQETLSSMAIGGIAALPIALIPLRGLTGYDVFAWSRWIWGGAYAVGLIGFFVVLMPLPFSWTGVHINLVVWVGVYLAYALAAVVAWLVLARPWARARTPEETGQTGQTETIDTPETA
ncbi:MAG TPA: hypothetical protein VGF80_15880 [Galbitalea sp.]